MKINLALRELHHSERTLASTFSAVATRHAAEHEIHHVAHDLAAWSRNHLSELAEAAHRYGLDLDAAPSTEPLTSLAHAELSELLGHPPEPALVLLADLRRVHTVTAGVSVDWEILAQGAQAVKDQDLLALTQRCHPQTLRQLRWSNATIKVLAPQVLAS